MKIIENKTPYLTLKHLDHIDRYRQAYGEGYFTSDLIELERKNLEAGQPSARCGENGKCYELFTDSGEHVGDIVLALVNLADFGEAPEERYELDLSIFHEFAGKGYAKQALAQFTAYYKQHYAQPLEAILMRSNPQFDHVRSLFEHAGFVHTGEFGDGNLVLTLQRG